MEKVKFGIRFTVNKYAWSAVDEFIDRTQDDPSSDLKTRFIEFCEQVKSKEVKPSTLVDVDVLQWFAGELYHRADIDYIICEWPDEPDTVAGGKMFYERYKKLKAIHGSLIR